jgi:hypothetical protein
MRAKASLLFLLVLGIPLITVTASADIFSITGTAFSGSEEAVLTKT